MTDFTKERYAKESRRSFHPTRRGSLLKSRLVRMWPTVADTRLPNHSIEVTQKFYPWTIWQFEPNCTRMSGRVKTTAVRDI